MTRLKQLLLTLAVLSGLLVPVVGLSRQASAVDIFKNTCDKIAKDASAQGTNAPSVCQDVTSHQTENPIVHILKGAITVLSYVVGIAAIIGILVSSVRMITAGGDSNTIAQARSGVIYSLIGVLVAAFSQAIVVFVLNKI